MCADNLMRRALARKNKNKLTRVMHIKCLKGCIRNSSRPKRSPIIIRKYAAKWAVTHTLLLAADYLVNFCARSGVFGSWAHWHMGRLTKVAFELGPGCRAIARIVALSTDRKY